MWCSSFDYFYRFISCLAPLPLMLAFFDGLVHFYCPFHIIFLPYQRRVAVSLWRDQLIPDIPFTFLWPLSPLLSHVWLLCLLYFLLSLQDSSLSSTFLRRRSGLHRALRPIDSCQHYHGLGILRIIGWFSFS